MWSQKLAEMKDFFFVKMRLKKLCENLRNKAFGLKLSKQFEEKVEQD